MEQINNVLTNLLTLTQAGKVNWRTTVRRNEFLAVLGSQSVVIAKASGGLPEPEYKIEVFDSRGAMVAHFLSRTYESTQQPTQFDDLRRENMERLFERAQVSAVNDGLEDLVERLDKLIEDLEKV